MSPMTSLALAAAAGFKAGTVPTIGTGSRSRRTANAEVLAVLQPTTTRSGPSRSIAVPISSVKRERSASSPFPP
jgi:hypothetical protein